MERLARPAAGRDFRTPQHKRPILCQYGLLELVPGLLSQAGVGELPGR